ncbi:mandelate racemase/muconate lactonizing enzyme family protein [Halalkalicoccus jeotgali]|uniref:o-succinylbenzoate synthase n=1 Tax=Halalkalicoccus jeotgali (strain DSM 18796 / CECT 7217 / JCM 14584 / KCTC 4019 / B3) TaxID=795797 RepID=D8J2U2_HALJB|nr:o-succinylbenzoate synthase [Halalkalicoccus jeotgali]ADJ15049.1 Mandelate racemase/muconate lactonizing protein [Halalkalicoccus jeotgali B3]ELY34933.1 Mandelate racemase/muconate lactonizing protein [Halalkalicoccus jeotgali B3]
MNCEEFSLPLKTPLSTAGGDIRERRGFAVRIGGGVGEATPLPGWTESVEECREALSGIEDPDAALATLDDRPAARHAVSLALADGAARERAVPLSRHLGGDEDLTGTVAVNATVGDGSPEGSAAAAREAVESGFRTVKCKVGARSVESDLKRIRAVREAVGPGPAIRVDANGGWSREEAEHALDGLAEFDIALVEQPLSADDIAGHRELPRRIPLALDESLAGHTPDEIEGVADVADVFVLKPMALGGVDRVVEVGSRLRAEGVGVVVTTTIDAVIARTGAIHAAAALGIERACGLATADLLAADLAPDPAPVRAGTVAVPRGPGLGTDGPWTGGGADA